MLVLLPIYLFSDEQIINSTGKRQTQDLPLRPGLIRPREGTL